MKLIGYFLVFSLLISAVSAAVSVTLDEPDASEEMTRGATYSYDVDWSGGDADLNVTLCNFYYLHQGDSAWSLIGTNTTEEPSDSLTTHTLLSTVPDNFGTNTFNATCFFVNKTGAFNYSVSDLSASVSVKQYSTGEASEAAIDLLVGSAAALFSFVSIIALVLLFVWVRKKFR
jgi:hypothetical protein